MTSSFLITLEVDSCPCDCGSCQETIQRGEKAHWIPGRGVFREECVVAPIPEHLEIALRSLRVGMPGVRDKDIRWSGNFLRVVITPNLALIIRSAEGGGVHLYLGSPRPGVDAIDTQETGALTTEGAVLEWVDEILVPLLFDHTQALRVEAITIERALGFES